MVKNPREKTRSCRIHFLNKPVPIYVEEDKITRPTAIYINQNKVIVTSIEDFWRIDDEWWRDECISRIYYRCLIRDNLQITIFRDIQTSIWYKQND
jgi:hypothetical protein